MAKEALYFSVAQLDGLPLTGAHDYTLTFPKGELPPVGAFWSLILYDATTFWLVANPINRYEIASHTDGLIYGADGALTIAVQNGQPSSPLGQLAARSGGRVPPDSAHLHPQAGDPRRRLDTAAAQTDRLTSPDDPRLRWQGWGYGRGVRRRRSRPSRMRSSPQTNSTALSYPDSGSLVAISARYG